MIHYVRQTIAYHWTIHAIAMYRKQSRTFINTECIILLNKLDAAFFVSIWRICITRQRDISRPYKLIMSSLQSSPLNAVSVKSCPVLQHRRETTNDRVAKISYAAFTPGHMSSGNMCPGRATCIWIHMSTDTCRRIQVARPVYLWTVGYLGYIHLCHGRLVSLCIQQQTGDKLATILSVADTGYMSTATMCPGVNAALDQQKQWDRIARSEKKNRRQNGISVLE